MLALFLNLILNVKLLIQAKNKNQTITNFDIYKDSIFLCIMQNNSRKISGQVHQIHVD